MSETAPAGDNTKPGIPAGWPPGPGYVLHQTKGGLIDGIRLAITTGGPDTIDQQIVDEITVFTPGLAAGWIERQRQEAWLREPVMNNPTPTRPPQALEQLVGHVTEKISEERIVELEAALRTMVGGFVELSTNMYFPVRCVESHDGGIDVNDNDGETFAHFACDDEDREKEAEAACARVNAAVALCGADGNDPDPLVTLVMRTEVWPEDDEQGMAPEVDGDEPANDWTQGERTSIAHAFERAGDACTLVQSLDPEGEATHTERRMIRRAATLFSRAADDLHSVKETNK